MLASVAMVINYLGSNGAPVFTTLVLMTGITAAIPYGFSALAQLKWRCIDHRTLQTPRFVRDMIVAVLALVFSILFIWYSRNTGHSFWVYWAPFVLAGGALVLGIPVYLGKRRHMSRRRRAALPVNTAARPRQGPEMRIVIALGGNALLRRGEPMTAEASGPTSGRGGRDAAASDRPQHRGACMATGRRWDRWPCRRTRTRGAAGPARFLDAGTQGMIGYVIEQELAQRAAAQTPFATLLTMIEVDPR